MRTTIWTGITAFFGLSATVLAGCSVGPTAITGNLQGRRAQAFDVDGDWLSFRAFTADGAPYDSFRLHKQADGSKILHEGIGDKASE